MNVYILLLLLVRRKKKKRTDGTEMEPRKIAYSATNFNTHANKVLFIHMGLILSEKKKKESFFILSRDF